MSEFYQKCILVFMQIIRYSCQISTTLEFSRQILKKNAQKQNFTPTRPVAVELFHADGQTDWQRDLKKLIFVLRNFAKAPKKEIHAKFLRKCRCPNLHLAASAAGCHRDVRYVCRSITTSSRGVMQSAKTVQKTSYFLLPYVIVMVIKFLGVTSHIFFLSSQSEVYLQRKPKHTSPIADTTRTVQHKESHSRL